MEESWGRSVLPGASCQPNLSCSIFIKYANTNTPPPAKTLMQLTISVHSVKMYLNWDGSFKKNPTKQKTQKTTIKPDKQTNKKNPTKLLVFLQNQLQMLTLCVLVPLKQHSISQPAQGCKGNTFQYCHCPLLWVSLGGRCSHQFQAAASLANIAAARRGHGASWRYLRG